MLNVLVLIIAFVAMTAVRNVYLEMFETFFPDFEAPRVLHTYLLGIGLLFIVSVLNIFAIKSKVMSIWKRKD
jgi:ABC-type sulfate transport system permease component